MRPKALIGVALAAAVSVGCSTNQPIDDRSTEVPADARPTSAIIQEPRVTNEIYEPAATITRTPPARQYMVSGLWRWSPEEQRWACTQRTCDPAAKPSYRALEHQQVEEKEDG